MNETPQQPIRCDTPPPPLGHVIQELTHAQKYGNVWTVSKWIEGITLESKLRKKREANELI